MYCVLAGIAWGAYYLTESWIVVILLVVAWFGGNVLFVTFLQARQELRDREQLEREIHEADAEAEDDPRDDVFDDGIPDWAWRPKER